ncbi:MAG: Gfo/Idh/MocA family oxidoreductase [Oscillospiraceae bacterium]|nr:Gfo/Idh/MocA family oxidoreductase [Oscillospiraceae bacterium]
MKIGVLGTGKIVHVITKTLKGMDSMECYAIASRTKERGETAAKEFGFQVGYGSYEELVADPNVELVYIATPHSRHFEDMKLCIAAGKPVLCEKAFTLNAAQAAEIQAMAKDAGVYVAEAIWTRYQPSRQLINEVIDSGIIGKVNTLTANLSYVISHIERLFKPELAGGALLDIGVYGINFALMHFGEDIVRMESSVQMMETGVDGMETITMFYRDGKMAVLTHSAYCRSDRKGIFHGDKGYIVVENINNPQSISVYDDNDNLVKFIAVPEQITGYEYQFEECARCIAEGKIESDSMPLDESVKLMKVMDALRKSWGMVYPQER